MKNRLNKSLSRLKKEKLVKEDKELISKKISPFEFKIFKTLSDKYDLSLCLEEFCCSLWNCVFNKVM